MTKSVFVSDGDLLVPTGLARGPWFPDAQHGAPPSCALARAAALHGDAEKFQVARITVELVRPVPLEPLAIHVEDIRPGNRVNLLDLTMTCNGTIVALARALRIRLDDLMMPNSSVEPVAVEDPMSLTAPDTDDGTLGRHGELETYAADAVEHRFVSGGFGQFGDAVDWVRLRHRLVDSEPNMPIVVAMAAADFANGVSSRLSRDEGWTYINPDLTVHLHRMPVGEWVRIESTMSAQPAGIGMAESRMSDGTGLIGRAVQSLLISR